MLILQIALGVVLGGIILVFLPQILSAGFWLFLAALAIGIVVAVISTDIGKGVAFGAIALVAVGWLFSQSTLETKKAAIAEPEKESTRLRQDDVARTDKYAAATLSERAKDDAAYHKRMTYVSAGIVAGIFVLSVIAMFIITAN
ncbi:MAG: hypothetical protein Q8J99_00655 [Sulfuritalea sp.]|nr:hypothetical protein [Sulfuritalea sp.]